jgi:hypothetical protein
MSCDAGLQMSVEQLGSLVTTIGIARISVRDGVNVLSFASVAEAKAKIPGVVREILRFHDYSDCKVEIYVGRQKKNYKWLKCAYALIATYSAPRELEKFPTSQLVNEIYRRKREEWETICDNTWPDFLRDEMFKMFGVTGNAWKEKINKLVAGSRVDARSGRPK